MAASADGLIQLRAPTPHHREGLLRLADAVSDSRRGALLPANLRLSRVAEGAGGLLPQPYEAIVQVRNRRRGRIGLFVGALGRTRHTTHNTRAARRPSRTAVDGRPPPLIVVTPYRVVTPLHKAYRRMTLRKVPVENFSKYSARREAPTHVACAMSGSGAREHDSRERWRLRQSRLEYAHSTHVNTTCKL